MSSQAALDAIIALGAADADVFPDRETWLAARPATLGASEVAGVLGLSPWETPLTVWAQKRRLLPPVAQTEAMEMGIRLEPVVADLYAARSGRQVVDVGATTRFRSRTVSCLSATLDRIIMGDPRGPGALECKAPSGRQAWAWETGAPTHYLVQLQAQLLVTGCRWGALAALVDRQFVWLEVEADPEVHRQILAGVAWFWPLVASGTAPTASGTGTTDEVAVLKRLHPHEAPGVAIALPPESAEWDARRLEAAAEIEKWDAIKTQQEYRLRAAIGEAELGVLPSGAKYSLKTVKRAAYTVAASEARQLRRLKGPGEKAGSKEGA